MTRLITKTYTIGRNAENDINPRQMPALDTERISRKHAVIDFYNDGTMDITDKSSNGTFVNDKRLQKDMPTPVRTSDVITLAGIRFRWQTLPEFEGMTEVTSTPNTGYTPPAAAPNRPPVKGAAAKQGFSWKSAAIGAVVLLVGIIGLVIWLAEPDPVPVPVRTQEENNNATFKIYIYEDVEVGQDAQGESLSIRAIHSNGSGVFIDSVNGYILTNYHVISEYYENTDSKPEIWVSSSVLDKAYKAEEVIISSPDTEHKGIDVAIVKLSSQMNQALQEKRVRPVVFANIDENQKELLKGKELYALGYPGISDSQREAALSRYRDEIKNATGSQMNAISKYQDIENELRDVKPSTTFLSGRIGKIDVYSPKNSHLFIEHQAPIAQGMSGGPTFLANEHTLIGLNQSYKVDRNANRVYKSVFLPEILQLISQDTTHEHTELRAVQPYKP